MKGKTYVLICALFAMLPTISARQFEQGEKIFINADQTWHDYELNWSADNAHLLLYVWNSGATGWVNLTQESGSIYSGEMPAGDWEKYIIMRKSNDSPNWDGVWNQTCDLSFTAYAANNIITKFWKKPDNNDCNNSSAEWKTYSPAIGKIAALAAAEQQEHISICPSALGGPYSLHVKLTDDKKAYAYDNVAAHAWYRSTDGTNWISVDDYAGVARDEESDKDVINNMLPTSGSTIYYYLYSTKPSGRRLIKLTTDATGCDLDCTITAFEVACSEVNANDTTYTLDGMVAFGEPNGSLVITCDGKSTTITSPKSPQIFSITGLPAAVTSGKKTTATATFTGNGSCTATATVNIPNATQGITYTHLDVLVGETTALNPTGANYTNEHKWYVDGIEQPDLQNAQTSTAFNEPNTTKYTYREFNPPAGDMGDMMSNGGYEDKNFDYGTVGSASTISAYDFWGLMENISTAGNYYNTHPGANNGFAVVQSANHFAPSYAGITAREGSFFALFDAASDGVPDKKAWFTNTLKSPNLKLQKGTTYLFSFWAANINNYGEMDNAAKLQFQIEYNGKKEKLGEVLDLNSAEFRNNRWHQCSATFLADADASDVTISVVNLNTNTLNTGNDFALDDIQFRAVSSATRSVRLQQVFEVQTHEPHIFSLATSVSTMPCGVAEYDVTITVTYDNPKGNLVIEDLTDGKVLVSRALGEPDWDKKKTMDYTLHLDTSSVDLHTYKAYFADWMTATAEGSSAEPTYTDCPPEPTCNDGVMYRKWENVIFIDNHNQRYTAYQWYKNGKPMSGETAQRYYAGNGVSLRNTPDRYHCVMTCTDGTTDETCAHPFDNIPSSADKVNAVGMLLDGVGVYPTSVGAGETVTVSKAFTGAVQVTLLTLTGQTVTTTVFTAAESTLAMPAIPGIYMLQLKETTNQRIIKIHVY